MILSFCMLTAMGTAPASPRFEPTVIEVDMSAFFSIKSEVSEGEEQREHDQIYPGVARVLEAAGVPIAAPQADDDRELLEVAGVPTVDVHAQQANVLRLEFSSTDFVNSVYRIHVSVRRPDASYKAIPALTCGPDCLSENVEPFLQKNQAVILALLETPPPAKPKAELAGVPPRPVDPKSAAQPPETTPSVAKEAPIGPVGIAGIVVGGAGLGGVLWGSTALGLDRRSDWENGPDEREQRGRYFNTGTGVALGVGAGLLATGIVMILVDQLAPKHRKRRRSSSAMRLTPLRISF